MPMDESDMEHVYEAVFGNGKPGLVERMTNVERAMWRNPHTGEQGLVADVRDVRGFMRDLVTLGRAFMILFGLGVIGWLVRLFVPGV